MRSRTSAPSVRSRGIDRIEDVDAVVLESNGSLSVLKSAHSDASALLDVRDDERSSR
ncbi:YetF domain-containing protein [Bradyrhizobium canariense]|uniref:YetF domain-containing protein n=1 Tax=Bradyrhizobium canariense TaxID=255045 RepID=UPI001177407F